MIKKDELFITTTMGALFTILQECIGLDRVDLGLQRFQSMEEGTYGVLEYVHLSLWLCSIQRLLEYPHMKDGAQIRYFLSTVHD